MSQRLAHEAAALLFEQLAGAAASGLALHTVVAILAEDTSLPRHTRRVFRSLAASLVSGASLAASLGAQPQAFGSACADLVARAEREQELARTLSALAEDEWLEERALRAQGIAHLWPLTVLAVLVVVYFISAVFVLPAFQAEYRAVGAELPSSASSLFALRTFGGLLVVFCFILAVVALVAFGKVSGGMRRSWAALTFRVPFVRRYRISRFACRFLNWLASFSSNPAMQGAALAHLSASLSTPSLARLAAAVATDLARGYKLSGALAQCRELPPGIATYARLGEALGDLERAMQQATQRAALEDDMASRRYERGMVLSLYLGVAVLVGAYVYSMYSLVFGLGQLT